jgi:hypothetical protein
MQYPHECRKVTANDVFSIDNITEPTKTSNIGIILPHLLPAPAYFSLFLCTVLP